MFHQLSKHLEFCQKYSTACHIFNSLLGVWISRCTYLDIFESTNFFFPDSQIFPCTRSIFKSNLPVHTHLMVSGFTPEKLGLHVVPLYWLTVQLETGHHVRKYSDSPSTGYRIRYRIIFSTLESRFQTIQICCRIHQRRVDRGHIQKEKSCRLKNLWIRVGGAENLHLLPPVQLVLIQLPSPWPC